MMMEYVGSYKKPDEQLYNMKHPLKGWLNKKCYLDFQSKRDFSLL